MTDIRIRQLLALKEEESHQLHLAHAELQRQLQHCLIRQYQVEGATEVLRHLCADLEDPAGPTAGEGVS